MTTDEAKEMSNVALWTSCKNDRKLFNAIRKKSHLFDSQRDCLNFLKKLSTEIAIQNKELRKRNMLDL